MPKKILVVDDYQDVRTLLARSLAARGYEIVEVSSGAEAVQKALSDKFDIIIMDLGLPGMTGIDTTRELKKHSTTAHVPIVGYSGLSLRRIKARALQAGMAAFLLKPVSLQIIQEVIEKYILP